MSRFANCIHRGISTYCTSVIPCLRPFPMWRGKKNGTLDFQISLFTLLTTSVSMLIAFYSFMYITCISIRLISSSLCLSGHCMGQWPRQRHIVGLHQLHILLFRPWPRCVKAVKTGTVIIPKRPPQKTTAWPQPTVLWGEIRRFILDTSCPYNIPNTPKFCSTGSHWELRHFPQRKGRAPQRIVKW